MLGLFLKRLETSPVSSMLLLRSRLVTQDVASTGTTRELKLAEEAPTVSLIPGAELKSGSSKLPVSPVSRKLTVTYLVVATVDVIDETMDDKKVGGTVPVNVGFVETSNT